jgi:6-phosphogluconolactonase
MVKIFKDKSELAIAFCDELMKLSNEKEKFYFALSGGSTPEIIYEMLSKEYKQKINWKKIHLFWSDERCVHPDDVESNYRMAKKYLLDFIDIPGENVHRIKGENNPELEAERYSEEISNIVNTENGLPRFDIMMLGLGEDGHTASVFPDQMHLLDTDKICEVAVHPSSGQKRITLTGNVINNSEQVSFLVTGKGKAEILKKILLEKNKIYPAEFIYPLNGNMNYFVDKEASLSLNKK